MSEASSKKRKRASDAAANLSKKVAINCPPPTASVSKVVRPESYPPVVGKAWLDANAAERMELLT
jgi:hypothetical protein